MKNFAASWVEVKMTNMNGVWKKLCPQFVHDFKGFTKTIHDVAQKVVDLGHQLLLRLEVEVDDVEMLLESHAEELSNDDLLELKAQKAAEEGRAWMKQPLSNLQRDLQ